MDPPPAYFARPSRTPRDLETASIRSAAPSYISNAPSYTSTVPNSSRPTGLPPTTPRSNSIPTLSSFRAPSWSHTSSSNPTSRHYHSVASRRASALTAREQSSLLAAALQPSGLAQMKIKLSEEERERAMRTLEDPELVGEEEARKNREERERRERGWGVLEQEDRRWDWLIAQMADWEEREQSWGKFRREVEGGKRAKLAKRLGIGR